MHCTPQHSMALERVAKLLVQFLEPGLVGSYCMHNPVLPNVVLRSLSESEEQGKKSNTILAELIATLPILAVSLRESQLVQQAIKAFTELQEGGSE